MGRWLITIEGEEARREAETWEFVVDDHHRSTLGTPHGWDLVRSFCNRMSPLSGVATECGGETEQPARLELLHRRQGRGPRLAHLPPVRPGFGCVQRGRRGRLRG